YSKLQKKRILKKRQEYLLKQEVEKERNNAFIWVDIRWNYIIVVFVLEFLAMLISSIVIPLNLEYFNFGYYWLFGYSPLLIASIIYIIYLIVDLKKSEMEFPNPFYCSARRK